MGESFRKILLINSLFFVLCCSSCKQKDSAQENSLDSSPQQMISNFVLTHQKNGKKQWVLKSPQAEVKEEFIEVIQPEILFYDETGKIISFITAQQGTIDHQNQDLALKGAVKVVSEERKTTLTTDNLYWSAQKQKIYTDDYVQQIKEDLIISGKGLEADPSLEKIIIKENVKVINQ